MKTLFIDCGMGASGDMLTAALLELIPDREAFIKRMNSIGIPGVEVKMESCVKCGITGTHVTVTVNGEEETETLHEHHHSHEHNHDHEHEQHHHDHHDHDHEQHHHDHHDHDHDHEHEHHHHSGIHDIMHIVNELAIPQQVKENVMAVYKLIAEAESKVHGVPVTDIHFHEVGTMDAIADITAVCLLMDMLRPGRIIVSPVHVGSGRVRCAHGVLPVPAPATAHILRGIPIYGGSIEGELCTPTGAALLKHFATAFGDMPVMRTEVIGYGMGAKDFAVANCVRAMLGEIEDERDTVYELSCNIDDMTAEEMGFAAERLFEVGALDVFTAPICMKKGRPGMLLHVLCRDEQRSEIINAIFRHTSTIGIRETKRDRYVLTRRTETVKTQYGEVRRKVSFGYGADRCKYEYEDIARIARENDMSIRDVIDTLNR